MDTLLLNAPEHPLFSQSGEWITRIRIQIWSEVSWTIYICICIIYIHITVWEKNTTVWVTKATSMQGFATFHAVMKYIDIDLEIRLIHNDIIVNIIKVYYIIHVISKSCQSLYIYISVCVCVSWKSGADPTWKFWAKAAVIEASLEKHDIIGNPVKVKQLRSAAHAASDIWASLTMGYIVPSNGNV